MKRNFNDEELLNKINDSFKKITPEPNFSELKDRLNRSMEMMEEKKKFNFKLVLAPVVLLACLVLVFSLLINKPQANGSGYISIDINPSLELYTDENNLVSQVNPLNDDANLLVEDLKLVGLSATKAVEEITTKAIEMGYITEDQNQDILVSVSKNMENTKVYDDLNKVIIETLEANNVTARVNTTVVKVTDEIVEEASKLGTTLGKLNLVGEDLDLAIASITDIIRENATNASQVITNVSYTTSTNVSNDLEKYKELLYQELELEAQIEKLEKAYKAKEITYEEYRNLKYDIKKELEKLDDELDYLEDLLERNGFNYDDALDYLESEIEKEFISQNIEDEELKNLYQELNDLDSLETRLKTDYRSGLIDKKTYEYEDEKLDLKEDYLEALIEYYERESKNNFDEAKYQEYKSLLEEKYHNDLAYLDGDITKSAYYEKTKELDKAIKNLLYAKLEGEIVNFENYYMLKKELYEKYINGLISKNEYKNQLDYLDDYLDELEDYYEDGLDLTEIYEEYAHLTGASKYFEMLEDLRTDFEKGLITLDEFIKEKVKIEEFLDNLEDLDEDIEDSFNKMNEDLQDFFEDLDEAFKEFGSKLEVQIKEFEAEAKKLKEDLKNGSITYQEFKRLMEDLEERFEDLEDRYDD